MRSEENKKLGTSLGVLSVATKASRDRWGFDPSLPLEIKLTLERRVAAGIEIKFQIKS